MRIAICDDEKVFLKNMEAKIYRIIPKLDCTVELFSSAEDLLNSTLDFDMIFLDIEMGGIDGMTAARKIRQTDRRTPLIFITSHTEMALEGYEVDAFRFLKKPVEDVKLAQTLHDLKLMNENMRGVLIRSEGEDIVVAPSQVLYIESDNNYVRIVTTSDIYAARMKLADAVDAFNHVSDSFRRVHRCTAVNMMHVSRIRDKEACLDSGNAIGISRSYLTAFKKDLYEYVRETAR